MDSRSRRDSSASSAALSILQGIPHISLTRVSIDTVDYIPGIASDMAGMVRLNDVYAL